MDTMNNNRLSSADTSTGHGISPSTSCTTLQGNHPPDIPRFVVQDSSTPVGPGDKSGGADTSILVVDWDGPDDPKNPKK